jgi:hypothetical protein
VIRPEAAGSRLRRRIATVAGLLALVLAASGGYFAGWRNASGSAPQSFQEDVRRLEIERITAENRRLHARVAELEMSRRLDRQAYGEVERTLGDLQSRLARQGDDLAFYRSIVSPADGLQGLRIQKFTVAPGTEPRQFVLQLTLVQAMRHESIVSGLAQLTLAGMQRDVPARHSVGELLGRPRARLPFSFRYFQTLEQAVTLPEGFEPHQVEVRLQSGKLKAPVVEAFPWNPGPPKTANRASL